MTAIPAAAVEDALARIDELLANRDNVEPDPDELLTALAGACLVDTDRLSLALIFLLTRYREALAELDTLRTAPTAAAERIRLLKKAEDLAPTGNPDRVRVLIELANAYAYGEERR